MCKGFSDHLLMSPPVPDAYARKHWCFPRDSFNSIVGLIAQTLMALEADLEYAMKFNLGPMGKFAPVYVLRRKWEKYYHFYCRMAACVFHLQMWRHWPAPCCRNKRRIASEFLHPPMPRREDDCFFEPAILLAGGDPHRDRIRFN